MELAPYQTYSKGFFFLITPPLLSLLVITKKFDKFVSETGWITLPRTGMDNGRPTPPSLIFFNSIL